MQRNFLISFTISTLLFFGAGKLSAATPAGFDDPNVKALHDTVDSMRIMAEKGDPEAQNGQGMISLYGFGGAPDFVVARGWFEKAANQGYPEAMVQLGNIYEKGLGVALDAGKAAVWYQKAAELKYPQGQFRLGLLYFEGAGVAKNETEGEKLLRSACDNGYRTSCGLLMWKDNKLAEARTAFTLECQAGEQTACGFLAQLGQAGAANDEVDPGKGRDQGKGGVGIYLVIGLVFVGLLIFWLIRNDPGDEEGKSK